MLELQAGTMKSARSSAVLVRNWWMMTIRGVIAIIFGLVLLLWPELTLDRVVALFAAYALLDGLWALVSAARVSRRSMVVWPVGLEGLVSVALGVVALRWPLVPRQIIYVIAAWGIITGVLEFVEASRVPAEQAARWLLATGGVSSVFLGLLILALPYAYRGHVVAALGIYALVFGVLVSAAAGGSRRGLPPT
jgi:uncharacterized membrane protein HdeD (DUF308 family)